MANLNAATALQFLRAAPEGANVTEELLFTGTTVAIADVVRFGVLPLGTRVPDLQVTTDAANAGATISVGWAYVDGSASAPAEYVAAGTSVAAAGVVRANTTGARTTLAKDAYLTLTVAGASISSATNIRVRPTIQNMGTP